MANSKTYPMPPPAVLVAKIASMGGPKLDPSQTVGKAIDCGVELGWSIDYDSAPAQIAITILNKPWLIPASTVWSHVDELFAA